jgi:hypothetical protein
MHYVACIKEEQKIIERTDHGRISSTLSGRYDAFQNVGGKYWLKIFETRIRLFWNIHLREISTATDVSAKTLPGGTPGPFARTIDEIGNGFIYGASPDINDVLQWLVPLVK